MNIIQKLRCSAALSPKIAILRSTIDIKYPHDFAKFDGGEGGALLENIQKEASFILGPFTSVVICDQKHEQNYKLDWGGHIYNRPFTI